MTSSAGVGVGFGFKIGGGGGSPRTGAIWPGGVARGTGVGVGVGFTRRAGVCVVVGVDLCCGAANGLLRRGRESCIRAAETKVDPTKVATVNAKTNEIENL